MPRRPATPPPPASPRDPAEDVFRAFAAARLGALVRYAHLLTGDPHAAEDLVQTALTRTWARWSKVERQDDPEAYVRTAILRLAMGGWRRRGREWVTDSPPDVPVRRDPTAESDERQRVWSALATLPPRQRAVLVLRYYEDRSEAQIAAALGVSPGTVKSQASKALASLRAAGALTEVVR